MARHKGYPGRIAGESDEDYQRRVAAFKAAQSEESPAEPEILEEVEPPAVEPDEEEENGPAAVEETEVAPSFPYIMPERYALNFDAEEIVNIRRAFTSDLRSGLLSQWTRERIPAVIEIIEGLSNGTLKVIPADK